ncbi:MAG TPA: alpha/beta hydrolase [Dongiaceae bacterium]|jgi:alpha-beta hydrolase superfamily lysophospholipase|nr:alpha/beta hydrolase [Dongiaceae bacterium]
MMRIATVLLFLLAACAPRLQTVATEKDAPYLSDTRFHTTDGADLPMRHWLPDGPPRAVILALHGFNDYSRAFARPGPAFARQGIALYAYDQRGFGATPDRGVWPGEAQLVKDARSALLLLRRLYPHTPLFLLGESMGGAIAMVAASQANPLPVDGVILSAAAVWGWDNLSGFSRFMLRNAAATIPWMVVRPTGVVLRASDNDEALRELGRDPLVIKRTRVDAAYYLVDLMDRAQHGAQNLREPRLLVLYGQREQILPRPSIMAMLENLPKSGHADRRIIFYPQGYHLLLRDLDAQMVIDDIAAWIADPHAPQLAARAATPPDGNAEAQP